MDNIFEKFDGYTIPNEYKDREHSFVKHLFLRQYLERLAYNIFKSWDEITYVDGFSGPWKSGNDQYQDTSFDIAISTLEKIAEQCSRQYKKTKKVNYIFIEKGKKPFKELEQYREKSPAKDRILALNGEFEELLSSIKPHIKGFGIIFIDPKGWTGYALKKVCSLFSRNSEVIINFMFDHINRFLNDTRDEIQKSFTELFGDTKWSESIGCMPSEKDIIAFYMKRMKEECGFKYAASSKILNPNKDRANYYLIYGTHHHKGLIEYRDCEMKAAKAEKALRAAKKLQAREQETQMVDLFGNKDESNYVTEQAYEAEQAVTSYIKGQKKTKYLDVLTYALESFRVTKNFIRDYLIEMHWSQEIKIESITSKQQKNISENAVIEYTNTISKTA